MATAKPTMVMTNGATITAAKSRSSIFSTPFQVIGHDLLDKLRHRPQKLQLSNQPPRHEKNADTDPDGEQHKEHCTTHPVEPATTARIPFDLRSCDRRRLPTSANLSAACRDHIVSQTQRGCCTIMGIRGAVKECQADRHLLQPLNISCRKG